MIPLFNPWHSKTCLFISLWRQLISSKSPSELAHLLNRLNRCELRRAVSLRVEQRRQIAIVEAVGRALGHRRFGMERDTKPSRFQHRQIIGSVADGERQAERNILFRGETYQRLPLAVAR